jgi:hypothetical protein
MNTALSSVFRAIMNNRKHAGKQFIAGVDADSFLEKLLPTINLCGGAQTLAEKTCPGEHFTMEEMIKKADMLENVRDYDEIASGRRNWLF